MLSSELVDNHVQLSSISFEHVAEHSDSFLFLAAKPRILSLGRDPHTTAAVLAQSNTSIGRWKADDGI